MHSQNPVEQQSLLQILRRAPRSRYMPLHSLLDIEERSNATLTAYDQQTGRKAYFFLLNGEPNIGLVSEEVFNQLVSAVREECGRNNWKAGIVFTTGQIPRRGIVVLELDIANVPIVFASKLRVFRGKHRAHPDTLPIESNVLRAAARGEY
jgi:hypothetical protein